MKMHKGLLIALVGLGGLTAAGTYLLVEEQRARAMAESKVVELTTQVEALRTARPAPAPETPPEEPEAAAPGKAAAKAAPTVLPTEYIRIIAETQAALETARKELSAARNDIAGLQARATQEQEQRDKLTAELAELNEALASTKRVVAATQTELKAKNDRLVRLETSEKLVREAAGKAEMESAKSLRTAQELEDLNRRREVLLNSMVRRYREVTDQYRTLSLRVQSRADQLGLDPGAGELSRIQTSVQQAEEEFRQLNGLSAQAAKLLRPNR
jgi:septal ring factor EnvC (AmiA/AmiB activator)